MRTAISGFSLDSVARVTGASIRIISIDMKTYVQVYWPSCKIIGLVLMNGTWIYRRDCSAEHAINMELYCLQSGKAIQILMRNRTSLNDVSIDKLLTKYMYKYKPKT